VALAEALWHDRQYADAEVVCQGILADLPNCLKANLILGQIWLNSQRDEEARALLQRAQELDPENKMAQALFGARSPLPLRTVRLPMTDADAPPVDLPYLADEETDVADNVVEAEAHPSAAPVTQVAPVSAPAQAELPAPQEPLAPEELSLWDVEYAYVSEHPGDYAARLDLARKLYSVGAVERALEQYSQLVQGDYEVLPAVARDLNLLVHLYPDSPKLEALLAAVRERARQEPPA
jgi:tetratricopeptide (TPR) repeat protein